MDERIIESGMEFIANNVFRIEKSQALLDAGEGIKSVEFIRMVNDKLMFLEAKTTFPNPEKTDVNRFDEEVNDICKKFIHSIALYSSIVLGVHYEELPCAFVAESKKTIWFILVICNHELAWCRYIQTKIRSSLPDYLQKIWNPQVFVINKKSAMKYNLVKKDSE
ncbi:MAG: hypothetical protein LBF63_02245 [Treponema sp.]|jgi:hypothetical protein|nr:hypothetical protein [Treponema sp.]